MGLLVNEHKRTNEAKATLVPGRKESEIGMDAKKRTVGDGLFDVPFGWRKPNCFARQAAMAELTGESHADFVTNADI